jgi:hypothetical protein
MADAPRGITKQDRERVARAGVGGLTMTRNALVQRSGFVGGLNRREKALLTLVNRQINILKPGSVPAAPRAASAATARSSGS